MASAREDQDQHLRSLRDTLERVTQPVGVSRQNEQAQPPNDHRTAAKFYEIQYNHCGRLGSGLSDMRGVRDESGWRMWLASAAVAVGSRGLAYLRMVKTASGAQAVQIVHGSGRGARRIEHFGAPAVVSTLRRCVRWI